LRLPLGLLLPLLFGCLLALLKFELSCPEAVAMAAACRGEAAREEKNESC